MDTLNEAQKHLSKFLNEFEAELDRGEKKSPEILDDYIDAARFMKKQFGRIGDRIVTATEMNKSWQIK